VERARGRDVGEKPPAMSSSSAAAEVVAMRVRKWFVGPPGLRWIQGRPGMPERSIERNGKDSKEGRESRVREESGKVGGAAGAGERHRVINGPPPEG